MPTVLIDRSVQKQCDKLFTTETLIQYGLLVGSSSSVEGNSTAKEDALYVVGAVPAALDDEPTPSSVPTNKLVSMAKKLSSQLCGGVQVIGIFVFVRATNRDSGLLLGLENSLNAFPSNNPKIASDKIALQITVNHASARIFSNTSKEWRQADTKFTSLAEQYVFLESSLSLTLQLCGRSSSETLSDLYGNDFSTLFGQLEKNMVVQVDNKYMPKDIAKNIPIGHLPAKDVHSVNFFPENNVLLGSSGDSGKFTYVEFSGTFSCKAYVHEKVSSDSALDVLLQDLKHSLHTRCTMTCLPGEGENGKIEYIPIRYDILSQSTVLSKCFSNYFILSTDNDAMDGVDDAKEELASMGVLAKDVSTRESLSNMNKASLTSLEKCQGGSERSIFTGAAKKQPSLDPADSRADGDGDVDVDLGLDDKEEEFEIEDVTPKDRVGGDLQNAAAHESDKKIEKADTKPASGSNMPMAFIGFGFFMVLLAIALMLFRV